MVSLPFLSALRLILYVIITRMVQFLDHLWSFADKKAALLDQVLARDV